MTAAARPVARSAGPGAARSKADHAYELIRERIVHHRAAPGERPASA